MVSISEPECTSNQSSLYFPNQKTAEINGLKCFRSLSELPKLRTSVSVITPPKVTLSVIQECKKLGISNIWLQPGSEDQSVIKAAQDLGIELIQDDCVLVNGDASMNAKL